MFILFLCYDFPPYSNPLLVLQLFSWRPGNSPLFVQAGVGIALSSHHRAHHPPIVVSIILPSSSHRCVHRHPTILPSHRRAHHPPISVPIILLLSCPSSCPSSSRRRAHRHPAVVPIIITSSFPAFILHRVRPQLRPPLDWVFSLRGRPLPFDNPTLSVPMFDKEHDEV